MNHIRTLVSIVAVATPVAARAAGTVQSYLAEIVVFINSTLLPLLMTVALLFFLVNMTRYFIVEGADSYAREQAKKFMMYGIGAFVIMTSVWGITNIITRSLGFQGSTIQCPDYIEQNRDCGTYFNPAPNDVRQWDGWI